MVDKEVGKVQGTKELIWQETKENTRCLSRKLARKLEKLSDSEEDANQGFDGEGDNELQSQEDSPWMTSENKEKR